MYYYSFNITDYVSHTSHLSEYEDLAYRRLIDWQHLHEKPIPEDIKEASRLIRMNARATDVEQVLNEFFTLAEHGYINDRCFDDIDKYHTAKTTASKAGKASAEARKKKRKQRLTTPVERPLNKRATNQEPRTNNQELKKKRDSSEQTGVCSKPALISIILKTGKTKDFSVDDVYELKKSFPRLSVDDVGNELMKCALWNKDNPKKRKTESGIGRHVSSWLSRVDENRSGKAQSNEAGAAWDNIIDQISAVGRAGEPKLDDKARRAIETLFGGWMCLCGQSTKDLQFARAKFINLYNGG